VCVYYILCYERPNNFEVCLQDAWKQVVFAYNIIGFCCDLLLQDIFPNSLRVMRSSLCRLQDKSAKPRPKPKPFFFFGSAKNRRSP